jgi:hypothetical protein
MICESVRLRAQTGRSAPNAGAVVPQPEFKLFVLAPII